MRNIFPVLIFFMSFIIIHAQTPYYLIDNPLNTNSSVKQIETKTPLSLKKPTSIDLKAYCFEFTSRQTIWFNLSNTGIVHNMSPFAPMTLFYGSACDQHGTWWIDEYFGLGLYTVDYTTGITTLKTILPLPPGFRMEGLAFDHTTNTMYGNAVAAGVWPFRTQLYKIDIESSPITITPIGPVQAPIVNVTLSCDRNGQLYTNDVNTMNFYAVDKRSGWLSLINSSILLTFTTSFDYDNNQLLCIAGTQLGAIDTQTGNTTVLGDFDLFLQPRALLVPPLESVTVINPVKGSADTAKPINIQWVCKGFNTANLYYSTDDGVNWISIATNIDSPDAEPPACNSFLWQPPVFNILTKLLIKVSKAQDPLFWDATEFYYLNPVPIIKGKMVITSPNGGEKLTGGNYYNIEWMRNGIITGPFSLEYTTDNGITWTRINRAPIAGIYKYSWLVPNINSNCCKIRIINYYSKVVYDASDYSFAINSSASATNYPNPFNPATKICFTLLNNDITSLKVYNSLGQEVKELVNKQLNAGYYEYEFDAKNLPSGIYYYELKSGSRREVNKMMLVK